VNSNLNPLFFIFKPSQMELVWKLQILTYNYGNLNSHSGSSIQISILGNLSDFYKHVCTPNKFSPNSKAIWILEFLVQILLGI
jgi:hypothetical protein